MEQDPLPLFFTEILIQPQYYFPCNYGLCCITLNLLNVRLRFVISIAKCDNLITWNLEIVKNEKSQENKKMKQEVQPKSRNHEKPCYSYAR